MKKLSKLLSFVVVVLVAGVVLSGASMASTTLQDVLLAAKELKASYIRLNNTKILDEELATYLKYPELAKLGSLKYYLHMARKTASSIKIPVFNAKLAESKIGFLEDQLDLFIKEYTVYVKKQRNKTSWAKVTLDIEGVSSLFGLGNRKHTAVKKVRSKKVASKRIRHTFRRRRVRRRCSKYLFVFASVPSISQSYDILAKLDKHGIKAGIIPVRVRGRRYYRVATYINSLAERRLYKQKVRKIFGRDLGSWVMCIGG